MDGADLAQWARIGVALHLLIFEEDHALVRMAAKPVMAVQIMPFGVRSAMYRASIEDRI